MLPLVPPTGEPPAGEQGQGDADQDLADSIRKSPTLARTATGLLRAMRMVTESVRAIVES